MQHDQTILHAPRVAEPVTLAGRLAEYFRARPGQWLDGRELARVAGYAAWRTRVSDIRRAPFSLNIENRVFRVERDGRSLTVSQYRYIPAEREARA